MKWFLFEEKADGEIKKKKEREKREMEEESNVEKD